MTQTEAEFLMAAYYALALVGHECGRVTCIYRCNADDPCSIHDTKWKRYYAPLDGNFDGWDY